MFIIKLVPVNKKLFIMILEKIKFKFWKLSNDFKYIRYLFDIISIIYSNYSHFKYKKKIKNFSYSKKFLVKNFDDAQFLIIKDKFIDKNKLIGMIHVLNHIGVPFAILSKSLFNKIDHKVLKLKVLICFNIFPELHNIKKYNKIILINRFKKNYIKDVVQINICPSDVMPHNSGLISLFTVSFVKKILNTNFPIITNYFKSGIGIVVDDVKGDFDYNFFLKSRWKLLLSVFVNDFFKKDKILNFKKNFYQRKFFDISPHSLSQTNFLYYDLSKGESINKKKFIKLWNFVKSKFNDNSIILSKIITSHFHLMSTSCVPILLKSKVKFYLCDIEPGEKEILYNKKFLPYGDPSLSTGNLERKNLFQIYSGSPSQSSKIKSSFYDFLEGDLSKKQLIKRLAYNLDLLIYSGFPIYLRTHEYNLIKLKKKLNAIQKFLNFYLKKQKLGLKKEKLSDISSSLLKRNSVFIKKINIRKNKLSVFCNKNKNIINIFYKNKIIDYKAFKKMKTGYEII